MKYVIVSNEICGGGVMKMVAEEKMMTVYLEKGENGNEVRNNER